jgi:hypothetical protein
VSPCNLESAAGADLRSIFAQAIFGSIILFIGILMQFWAGNNVADIPLGTLCSTYSGASDAMGVDDFNKFFDWSVLSMF